MEVKKKLLLSLCLGNGPKPPEKDLYTGQALAVLWPSWPLKEGRQELLLLLPRPCSVLS